MKGHRIRNIALLAVLAVAIIAALSGIYQVRTGDQAVVLTFGRITDTRESGLYWHMPFIQQVRTQSRTQLYTLEYGFRTTKTSTSQSQAEYQDMPDEAIMLTGDQNIVQIEAVYQVIVEDVPQFLYRVDEPFDTLQCAFETVLRRNLQSRTLDDALLNKQDIAAQLKDDFRAMLAPYNMGVDVRDVMIQNISVPTEVSDAYADVNNAMNEKTRKLDEAEKYKNQVVPAARAQAYQMLQQAEAYKAKTVAQAQGEVAEFNEVYQKYVNSKDITRKRLLIETLESILASAGKLYIVDDNGGMLKLLNIGEETPATAPAATPTPYAQPTPTPAPQETQQGGDQ